MGVAPSIFSALSSIGFLPSLQFHLCTQYSTSLCHFLFISSNQEQECQFFQRTKGHIMQFCEDSPCMQRGNYVSVARSTKPRHINSLGYMGDLFPPKLVEFKGATERKTTEQAIQLCTLKSTASK